MEVEVAEIARRMEEEMVLSLSEEALDEVDNSYEFAVVARVGGGDVPGKEGFAALLSKIWRPSEGVEFKSLAEDLLVVAFAKKEEKERVLRGGPWLCNDWVILVEEWRSDRLVSELRLSSFNVWIQVHNLPLGYTKGRPLEDIGKAIGDVIQIQEPAPPKRGVVAPVRYVRMLVKVDVSIPAKYGFFVKRRDGSPFWVDIRYERMPRMCFKCGRWNHEEDNCRELLGGRGDRYGPWLRADFSGNIGQGKEKEGSSVGMSSSDQHDAGSVGDLAMKEVGSNSVKYSGRDGVGDRSDSGEKNTCVTLREDLEGKGKELVIWNQGGCAEDRLGSGGLDYSVVMGGVAVVEDKKGKGKVGAEGLKSGASFLTDVKVGFVNQLLIDNIGVGDGDGFKVIDLTAKGQGVGIAGVEGSGSRVCACKKRRDRGVPSLKTERKRFKAVKPKNAAVKAIEQAKVELSQVWTHGVEGEVVLNDLISTEAAAQPRREP